MTEHPELTGEEISPTPKQETALPLNELMAPSSPVNVPDETHKHLPMLDDERCDVQDERPLHGNHLQAGCLEGSTSLKNTRRTIPKRVQQGRTEGYGTGGRSMIARGHNSRAWQILLASHPEFVQLHVDLDKIICKVINSIRKRLDRLDQLRSGISATRRIPSHTACLLRGRPGCLNQIQVQSQGSLLLEMGPRAYSLGPKR